MRGLGSGRDCRFGGYDCRFGGYTSWSTEGGRSDACGCREGAVRSWPYRFSPKVEAVEESEEERMGRCCAVGSVYVCGEAEENFESSNAQ